MRKIVAGGIIVLLAVACIVFFAVRAGNREAALRGEGFYPQECEVLWKGFDNNDDLNEVVRLRSEKGRFATGMLMRNRWGFWSFSKQSERTSAEQHMISAAWMRSAGLQSFAVGGSPTFVGEWHRFYCGDNAKQLVQFLPGQLPENVTAGIQQAGAEYTIHLITYGTPDVLNQLDVQALLVQAGCIAD